MGMNGKLFVSAESRRLAIRSHSSFGSSMRSKINGHCGLMIGPLVLSVYRNTIFIVFHFTDITAASDP